MPRKTPDELRAELLQKKAQLEERLRKIERQQSEKERKADTRRKIVVGALCLAHAEHKPEFKKWLSEALRKTLTKPSDKELFKDLLAVTDRSDLI